MTRLTAHGLQPHRVAGAVGFFTDFSSRSGGIESTSGKKPCPHEMKKLAIITIQIGILVLTCAVVWWHSFYRVIAQQLIVSLGETDPTVGPGFRCLYSSADYCGEVIAYGQSLGKVVYSPVFFWLGLTLFALGLAVLIVERFQK
jgi:hypothetical protein